MTDDDDRAMTRIFDRAFASVDVPPFDAIRHRRSRRVGTLLPTALALVAIVVIAGLIGGWLGGRRAPAAAPIPLGCGSPTALVPHPRSPSLTGAPIGPLLIRGYYAEGATTAVVQGFTAGYPTKMLALIARDMDADITLTGARCSDGQPLRFWMGPGRNATPFPQADLPVSEERMATTGQLDPTLEAVRLPTTGGIIDHGGYMLFASAGTYRIEGFANGRKIGEATLLVTTDVPPSIAPTSLETLARSLSFVPVVPTSDLLRDAQLHAELQTTGTVGTPYLVLEYHRADGAIVAQILEGPANCCLDAVRAGQPRPLVVREGVHAQRIPIEAQFGGPILWWVEPGAGTPIYVAITSNVLTPDEMMDLARSMAPWR